MVDKLDVASAVCEIVDDSGEQFKDILPFVNNLSTRGASDTVVSSLLAALHRICPLVYHSSFIAVLYESYSKFNNGYFVSEIIIKTQSKYNQTCLNSIKLN